MKLASALLMLASLPALAQQAPEEGAAEPTPEQATAAAAAFMQSLHPQHGAIALPNGIAKLALKDGFAYLDPEDSRKLIEDAWGNPPGSAKGTLGMIVPTTVSPLSAEGYGVVIGYQEDGHVSDDDADKIDYGDLLKDMQKATSAENEERQKQGYAAMTLVGWAEPPHYDKASHKIYWAKDLEVGGNHGLNYSIRVLGRKGVLEMNAVSGMEQLSVIREAMKEVVTFADFTEGNRYADFDSKTDKLAAYGLAALVAGGIAAKTGLIAKLVALLIAAKKLIFVAVAAVLGFFGKFFKRKPAANS